MRLTAAVIGAGTMGVGIAYVLAASGYATLVVEPDDSRANALTATVSSVAADGVRRGRLSANAAMTLPTSISRVRATTDLPIGLDLIVESVPESFELKRSVLADAEDRRSAVLASNTSTLSIDQLADGLKNPDRFLGMHFFNPVWSLALVEVIRGSHTTRKTLDLALEAVQRIGKQPAVINDSPGFATSRLDINNALEAMRMVEQGVAAAADIDRAVCLAYRHPVGPLHLSDIVGLDVRLDTAYALQSSLGDRFQPPKLLVEMVEQGNLGQKAGRGFYAWSGNAIIDS